MSHTLTTKETPTDFDIHPLIRDRWSPRSFSAEKINRETIHKILEAMRWAPSSMNSQPWEVLVGAKGTEIHDKLSQTLAPGNKNWASEAPVLLLAMAKTTFSNGAVHHGALYDLGLAVSNLSLEATHQGLSLHQIGGFDRQAVNTLLSLPFDIQPVVLIAIGYQSEPDRLPDTLRERELAPRQRKKVNEFARLALLEE